MNSSLTNRGASVGSHEGWVKDLVLAAHRRWFQLVGESGTKNYVRSSLDDIGQHPQRVFDLAQSERIQRLWGLRNRPSRELGDFGSFPTNIIDGLCSGVTTASKRLFIGIGMADWWDSLAVGRLRARFL
jgi:hypothetical protein